MACILVGDESKAIRDTLRHILLQAGLAFCVEAANGKEAVEEAKRVRPDNRRSGLSHAGDEWPTGSLLLAYSGLAEAENRDGQEFGDERVVDMALRLNQASAGVVLKNLLEAVDRWTGAAEQSDDLTVIVARF